MTPNSERHWTDEVAAGWASDVGLAIDDITLPDGELGVAHAHVVAEMARRGLERPKGDGSVGWGMKPRKRKFTPKPLTGVVPPAGPAPTAPPVAPGETVSPQQAMYDTIVRMCAVGATLIPMGGGGKRQPPPGFPSHPGLTADAAYAHRVAGGNLAAVMGVNSRMIAFDAEDFAATAAVEAAGIVPLVLPAKSQYASDILATVEGDEDSGKPNTKRGGTHTWLLLPEGIDPATLPHSGTIGIDLPNGGVIDVLAAGRYAMAPGSQLAVAPGVQYAVLVNRALDPSVELTALQVAPMWLFDRSVPCPPELAPLHGILTPVQPRERVERNARSSELDQLIDDVPWEQWLDGLGQIVFTGRYSGCGCPEYHYLGASTDKSLTLHEGCSEYGCGAHVWSGTMIAKEALDGEHLSRAQLRMVLAGETFKEACAAVNINIGEDRAELHGLDAESFDEAAERADERGDHGTAGELRAVAAKLREAAAERREQAKANGEIFFDAGEGQVRGAPPMMRGVPAASAPAAATGTETTTQTATPAGTSAPSENKVDQSPEAAIDASIPAGKKEIWERVKAKGFDPTSKTLYPLGFHSTPEIIAGVMDYSDRTRALFHKARSERNVHPIGLYLMDLIRFGNRLPTDLGPYPGVSLSTFVVLVGRAGTGKTQTGRADLSPTDWATLGVVRRNFAEGTWEYPLTGADVNLTHRLGSGQVIVDLYGGSEPVFNEETGVQIKGQKRFKPNDHLSIHVHEDELSAFIARSTGPQNTSLQTVCSAWARADIGDSSRNAGPKLAICGAVSPYNLFMSSGLQPKKSGPYFASEGVGYVQRNIHSAVTDPFRKVGLPVLANPGPQPAPSLALGHETVFVLCESIQLAMDDNEEDGSIDTLVGVSDMDSHLLMVRVRLACLVAAYHGSLVVTEECWEHTGVIMEHARRSRAYCEAAKDHAAQDEAGDAEVLRKYGIRVASAADRERVEACARRIIAKIVGEGPAGLTQGEAKKVLGSTRRGGKPSERDLYVEDALKVVKASDDIAFDGTRFRVVTKVAVNPAPAAGILQSVPNIGNVNVA
ncbi:hypothetical protein [Mycobacterium sp. 155]|uniref:hypothetical protein n=1 Tax=Mycobacterium sp. 155 TaxID=1157943 RepID=UPI000377AB5B|nr:hypothetical protein [Mycobacterium sp. 155]